MPKKAPKAADDERIARVGPILTQWSQRLGMHGNWRVFYSFSDDGDTTDVATIATIDPYRKSQLEFNRAVLDNLTDNELEEAVCHELAHLILYDVGQRIRDTFGRDSDLSQKLQDPIETVCDRLAQLFVSLWRHEPLNPEVR